MKENALNRNKYILIGEKYADILEKSIEITGLEPVFIPDNPFIDKRLSGHADLSVFYPGGECIFLAPYLKSSDFSRKVSETGLNITYTDIIQGEKYPADAQMNACLLGNKLLYSPKITAGEIINYFTIMSGFKLINCRQAYLNCAVCQVDDNSLITADRGVYESCKKSGLDVLLISPGFIDLPGFEYGFIGGAGFKTANDKIVFTGNLDSHPDKESILDFISSKNIKIDFLSNEAAFDIGGAIII